MVLKVDLCIKWCSSSREPEAVSSSELEYGPVKFFIFLVLLNLLISQVESSVYPGNRNKATSYCSVLQHVDFFLELKIHHAT